MHIADRLAPLKAARTLPHDEPMVLLCSAMDSQGSGRMSYLAHRPQHVLCGEDIGPLHQALQSGSGRWFGYLGYEMGMAHYGIASGLAPFCPMPGFWMMQPGQCQSWQHDDMPSLSASDNIASALLVPKTVCTNFSKADYLTIVEATLEQIRAGAFYQANITRKFCVEYDTPIDGLALFEVLCLASPSPFAAYIRTPFGEVISSSPEGFVQSDDAGNMRARPMKGTAPRGATKNEDDALRTALAHSDKDKAENLMIVDLMRHDLSRVCELSSVKVQGLHEVHAFAAYHQMISTVTGQRRANVGVLDAVMACLPPGSMTGAPKKAAIAWCAAQEKVARGVYSGALGWLDAAGPCDLSVVIRTIVVQGNRCEFQVGGGIVADSVPHDEWRETMVKASAIARVLGIEVEVLEAL